MVKFDTKHFMVEINGEHGFFEHHEHGDNYGGGLWFNGHALEDYDGVFELPKEIINGLREHGYKVTEDFE